MSRLLARCGPLLAVLAVLGAWWAAAATGALADPFVLPAPGAVARAAAALWRDGTLPHELGVTLGRTLAAFALALAAGAAMGLAMGRSATARAALRPLVGLGFATPKIALFPALVILLGLGSGAKVALGFAEAVFPIAAATAAAASQVPVPLVWSARAAGASRAAVALRVVLPAALPGLLSGARIGLVGAVIGVYIGEMVASSDGLGHLMVAGWRQLETDRLYVSVAAVSLLGFALDALLLLARRRLLRWAPEQAA
ncbi:ABC transporter permease [Actinomadura parmotrematis]|uniref:ABC transporter permease subunit n=1 Tax=Actinomadura parmotrematis TaxID=2864039 RepID=A0ABS7FZJ3_9ACTN|nr:ABC transporter permease subunit [Actinomadura parmotrematis]MBW8485869.1 ABC transporter permease subunit [Actinomadura parmotrematis]